MAGKSGKIRSVAGRWVLDSRGNPTLEVEVSDGRFSGRFSVPSGASTGRHEALELRDGGKRFHGKGVNKAIRNLKEIERKIKGMDPSDQEEIDLLMIDLDGTGNKSRLGANAILGVSMAVSRLAAIQKGMPFWKYLSELSGRKPSMPRPMFNVINGGVHAGSGLDIQEFMFLLPFRDIRKALRAASEIYQTLKGVIRRRYGKSQTGVGDEGGFAPKLRRTEQAIDLILDAAEESGYRVKICLDAAASEFFNGVDYQIDGKRLSAGELVDYYRELAGRYPIFSIEDPFQEEDFESFAELRRHVKVVGDDLVVTNPIRVQKAIEFRSIDFVLMKLNQIGTLTEYLEVLSLSEANRIRQIASHRSGETEDPYLADLSVGLGIPFIKSGAPARGERTSKYNQLLRIRESL